MINNNGILVSGIENNVFKNRAFLYGDAVFETIKVVNNHILFSENHYFRLMAAMRVMRMEIPMNFTLEYFETQIFETLKSNKILTAARVRVTVFREGDGFYLPNNNNVSFVVTAQKLENSLYAFDKNHYEVDLFKDFHISKHLLSTLKTTNKAVNILGSIYANENGLDNCLLINEDKNIVEALQGNIFMVNQNTIVTPPISEGCLNGIMRKQLIALLKKDSIYTFIEAVISPFDIQKADEIFISNVVKGIQPITKYRKKNFSTNCALYLTTQLNTEISKLL
jgi:branched-chain amino acid aminotransferase